MRTGIRQRADGAYVERADGFTPLGRSALVRRVDHEFVAYLLQDGMPLEDLDAVQEIGEALSLALQGRRIRARGNRLTVSPDLVPNVRIDSTEIYTIEVTYSCRAADGHAAIGVFHKEFTPGEEDTIVVRDAAGADVTPDLYRTSKDSDDA